MRKIGIIGAGNIGCALAKGLVIHGEMDPSVIYLSRKKIDLLARYNAEGYSVSDNETLVRECDIIILAVLPGQAEEVIKSLKGLLGKGNKLLISVVSAVTIQEIKNCMIRTTKSSFRSDILSF